MRATTTFLAAAFALVSAAANAQTAAEDARCLLVSSTYARSSKDATARQVAQTASAFYLGRVDGRYPPAVLKAAIAAELKLVNAGNAASIMNGCAARVSQAEARVQAAAPPAPRPQPKAPAGGNRVSGGGR
jgi:hypothetical protein